jgi:hypothetical protein
MFVAAAGCCLHDTGLLVLVIAPSVSPLRGEKRAHDRSQVSDAVQMQLWG